MALRTPDLGGPNPCPLEPSVAVRIEDGSPFRMSPLVSDVPVMPPLIALVRCPQGAVRHADQSLLNGPHIPCRQSPVHAERAQVEDPIPFDATRQVHEWVHVREDEIPDRAEHRFATVEAGIPRSGYRALLGAGAEQEGDVVEVVLRVAVVRDGRVSGVLW